MAPRLAATVMLLRDLAGEHEGRGGIEVFMVRRVAQSEFMPDIYVFPGGSVSADDSAVEQSEGICAATAPSAADPEGLTALGSGVRAAAIREVFEEANVLLAYRDGQLLAIDEENMARFADYRQAFNERRASLLEMARAEHLTLATDRLAYFAHWVTPEGSPKRFDTYFFLATAPAQQEAMYDRLETSEGVWVQPAEALARFEARQFPTAFPTYHQLRDLSAFGSVQEALSAAENRPVLLHMPILTQKDGKMQAHLPEDPEHPWRL
jgi:8-oxo-dGTP pyrophosphatase MutT (NUDIX family)